MSVINVKIDVHLQDITPKCLGYLLRLQEMQYTLFIYCLTSVNSRTYAGWERTDRWKEILISVKLVRGVRGVCYRSSNMGLCSFGRCSGMSSLFRWKICIYICSYGSKSDGLLICVRSVIVPLMFPYSCLQLSMSNARAERGSLFFMYLTCSRNLKFRLRLVCPTYDLWHVLHVILYIPLFSCDDVWIRVVGIKNCCNVVVALNAIPTLVFLNKFVILLIFGLWYVNVVQILCFFLAVYVIIFALYLVVEFLK